MNWLIKVQKRLYNSKLCCTTLDYVETVLILGSAINVCVYISSFFFFSWYSSSNYYFCNLIKKFAQ